MEVSHSVLCHIYVKPTSKILCKQKIIGLETSLHKVFNMASYDKRKMLFLTIFVIVILSLIILFTAKWY